MLMQPRIVAELQLQRVKQLFLFVRQPQRIRRIHRREIHVAHRILFSIDRDCAAVITNRLQKYPLFHPVLRMALDDLPLFLIL